MKMFKKLLFGALIVGLGAHDLSAAPKTRRQAPAAAPASTPPVGRVVRLSDGRTITIRDGVVVASTPAPAAALAAYLVVASPVVAGPASSGLVSVDLAVAALAWVGPRRFL